MCQSLYPFGLCFFFLSYTLYFSLSVCASVVTFRTYTNPMATILCEVPISDSGQ